MAKVETNAGEWRLHCRRAIEAWIALCRRGHEFTAEDIRTDIESTVGDPHHPNAWSALIGSVLRQARKAGVIELTDVCLASRPEAHGRLTRLYRKNA